MSTITFDFRHHYQRGERRESEQIAYQWDLGHVMEVFVPEDATYTIGYCFGDYEKTEDYAIDTKVQDPDGGYKLTAHIPNKYFERSRELRVYVVGSADDHIITTYEGFITIRGRLMPDDYVDDDPENGATQIIEVAREYATKSESFAVGGTGTRLGEDTDNAKYYLEQAEEVAESIPEDYSELSDDVDQLKNALSYAEKELMETAGYLSIEKSIAVRLTPQKLISFDAVAGHIYNIKFTISEVKTFTVYCTFRNSDGTDIVASSIAPGATEWEYTYTPESNNPNVYTLFQTGQDGETTITCKVTDSVCSLQKKVDIKYGVNLYDPSTDLFTGLLTNYGAVDTSYTTYKTTDFIEIPAGMTISNSIESGNYRQICFYSAAKSLHSYTANTATFSMPAGAKYVRISILASYTNYLALLHSATPIPFRQYSEIGGYLEGYKGFEKNDHIPYGNTLFTSTLNAQGTSSDNAHATCYMRKRNDNVIGVVFACSAYAVHTYFCAFDSSKNILADYSLTGASSTSQEHKVEFDDDVAYYSVFTLASSKGSSYISEIIEDCGIALVETKDTLDLRNDKTYREIKDAKLTDWSDLRFGMFIHWGVYSAWEGEYTGVNIDGEQIVVTNGTEWMWQANKIPKANYMAKQTDFTGGNWNPDYICQMAKMLGMEYIVITSRHHEGFSLMESENCEWDITTSGCDRDVLMELKEACNRHHLKFSLYVSPMMDWCDEGGFGQEAWHSGSDPYTHTQHQTFVTKQLAYLNELVEKYEPYAIWYDGGTYVSVPNEFKDQFNKNQMASYPYVIVNSRGEGIYDYELAENTYADYPNTDKKYERCNSLCGWGYNHRQDTLSNYLTPQAFIWDLAENVGRGFNYLLNISPKGDGSIPSPTFTRFTQIADFFHKYTYFNKAKRLCNYCQPSWGRPLGIGNSVYLLLLPNGSDTITVDSIVTSEIKGVYVYGIQNPDASANYEILGADSIQITNIPTTSDDYFPVVRIDFYNEPICLDYNIVDDEIGGLSFVRTVYNEWATTTTGVRLAGYYTFGTDNSTSISRFKFNGTTGTYSFSPDGTVSGTVNFAYSLYDSNMELISTGSTFSLTNGEIYCVQIEKTGSGTYNMAKLDIT